MIKNAIVFLSSNVVFTFFVVGLAALGSVFGLVLLALHNNRRRQQRTTAAASTVRSM